MYGRSGEALRSGRKVSPSARSGAYPETPSSSSRCVTKTRDAGLPPRLPPGPPPSFSLKEEVATGAALSQRFSNTTSGETCAGFSSSP
jgi:hypothetical protein